MGRMDPTLTFLAVLSQGMEIGDRVDHKRREMVVMVVDAAEEADNHEGIVGMEVGEEARQGVGFVRKRRRRRLFLSLRFL